VAFERQSGFAGCMIRQEGKLRQEREAVGKKKTKLNHQFTVEGLTSNHKKKGNKTTKIPLRDKQHP